MAEAAFRHKLARRVAASGAALLHLSDGKTLQVQPEELSAADDEGVLTGDEITAWSDVVAVSARGGARHATFLYALGDGASVLTEFPERSDALHHLALVAARSWPRNVDELAARCDDLTDEERTDVRMAAREVIETGDGMSRGLVLTLGIIGEAEDALAVGDAIHAIRSDEAESSDGWRWWFGLEALRMMDTRAAHMQIERIATLSSHPPAIAAAREKLLHIASDLGVPVWEVQDELVPSCGLDEDGRLRLDYGARQFDLRLDDELIPLLVERPGYERHRDLPPPTADDDQTLAGEARDRWLLTRELLLEAVPVQVHRFEEALAQQTRWEGRQWDRIVRRHPLLSHLVPRAIWGTYSKGGRRLIDTFRVADDDRSLWGPDDEPFELELDLSIGLAHPSEIPDDVRAAWGTVLADYEVVTMFPQIDRPVYRPEESFRKADGMPLEIVVPQRAALVLMHRRGWVEYESQYRWGNSPAVLRKVWRRHQVRAMIAYSTLDHELHVERVYFQRHSVPTNSLQMRDVPVVPYTETLYELEQLRAPQHTGGWAAVLNP